MALSTAEDDPETGDRLHDIETHRSILAYLGDRANPRWHDSWAYFAKCYMPAMRRYVYARLGRYGNHRGDRTQDAHDIVQAYFLGAMEKDWLGMKGEPIAKFRAYLTTQLRRFTSTWLRDRGALKRGGGACHVTDGLERITAREPDPADQIFERGCMETAIKRALKRVEQENPKHAEVIRILMRAQDKRFAITDIVETFGISRDGAYTRKLRALHLFSRRLAEELCEVVRDDRDLHAEWGRLRSFIPWLPKDGFGDDCVGAACVAT